MFDAVGVRWGVGRCGIVDVPEESLKGARRMVLRSGGAEVGRIVSKTIAWPVVCCSAVLVGAVAAGS